MISLLFYKLWSRVALLSWYICKALEFSFLCCIIARKRCLHSVHYAYYRYARQSSLAVWLRKKAFSAACRIREIRLYQAWPDKRFAPSTIMSKLYTTIPKLVIYAQLSLLKKSMKFSMEIFFWYVEWIDPSKLVPPDSLSLTLLFFVKFCSIAAGDSLTFLLSWQSDCYKQWAVEQHHQWYLICGLLVSDIPFLNGVSDRSGQR